MLLAQSTLGKGFACCVVVNVHSTDCVSRQSESRSSSQSLSPGVGRDFFARLMMHGMVPPTINHTTVDEEIDPKLNLTLNKTQERDVRVAMSNTFGFGGHNACVLFKKIS